METITAPLSTLSWEHLLLPQSPLEIVSPAGAALGRVITTPANLQALSVFGNYSKPPGKVEFMSSITLSPSMAKVNTLDLGPGWISSEKGALPTYNFPMKILIWNCRGAANPHFRRHFREIIKTHQPQMAVITETRISGDRAKRLSMNLGFSNTAIADAVGFAGGIWVMWNDQEIRCDILDVGAQDIHACIQVPPLFSPWIFSAIYARPNFADRRTLWDDLSVFASTHSSPWVIAGDFNEVLDSQDKFGGRAINTSRASLFRNCMNTCGMSDLGFSGSRFTWTNTQSTGNLIKERLDRAWANSSWNLLFPNANVLHLPRTHSDHCLILLSTDPIIATPILRPFRFESFWFSDPSVYSVIEKSWNPPSTSFAQKTVSLSNNIAIWNKEHFGNIFHRKKKIFARLAGIQKAQDSNPCAFLTNLESSLISELNDLLSIEEDFWALKSRMNWLFDGDRNTRFFHLTTIERRRANKILALKDPLGAWNYDESIIKHSLISHFSSLFTTSKLSVSRDFSTHLTFPIIPSSAHGALSATPLLAELKTVVWSFKPWKSPGPDGLHPGFFQKSWEITGNSILVVIRDIFATGLIPSPINHTFLCLIPKDKSPETVHHFRPISLCNTILKILSKALATRIRPFLGDLISPFQSSFLAGRSGMDNVIIVQEVIHRFRSFKGSKGAMIIKLDLEKAFDRLEWTSSEKSSPSSISLRFGLTSSCPLFPLHLCPSSLTEMSLIPSSPLEVSVKEIPSPLISSFCV